MQFQAICSKWNKKLTLSITASSREEARSILHKQGYSIIEIQEVVDTSLLQGGNFFYFDILLNGVIQSGKIQSDDIFKAYRKLVEDLKYDVHYIYTVENSPEDQKKIITAKVKDGYNMYLESIGEKVEEKKTNNFEETEEFSPQVMKDLEKYGKIIEDTTIKIQNLIIKNHEIITPEQKSVLERIEMELVNIRGMRNIGKIQSVLEESLKNIGAIEIEILKKGMIKEKAKFLAETNKLLQGVGSSEKIQTEEEKKNSIEYKFQSLLGKISWKKTETKPQTQNKVDTNSFVFFKNKRELDIYKKTHQKNDMAIIKAFFSGKFSVVKRLLLKRRLLLQNIQIIENRLQNRAVSYTKLVHGVDYYVNGFFGIISTLATVLSVGLFFYIIVYILWNSLDSMGIIDLELQKKSEFFLVILSLFILSVTLTRGWKTLILTCFLFVWVVSFLALNF